MDHPIQFRPISWEELRPFLIEQVHLAKQDLDHDARYINPGMFHTSCVEGFFVDGMLVGFARWDQSLGHLCSIYVRPSYRGKGISSRFIQSRPLVSLYVMHDNYAAHQLYKRLGFVFVPSNAPSRLRMAKRSSLAA